MSFPRDMHTLLSEKEKEIKQFIMETSLHVEKNGTSLEEKLRRDPKFSFLNPDNEYNGYYRKMLSEKSSSPGRDNQNFDSKHVKSTEPPEPCPFSFMSYDKDLTPRDLEVIKLTAKFCVANEDLKYIEKMKLKFKDDPKFAFLNPGHPLNVTFIQFLNQFKHVKANILGPPMFYFKKNEDFKHVILRKSFQRAEYKEFEKTARDERDRTLKLHMIQFAALDWAHFKVAGKVNLPAENHVEELLPQPLDFTQLSLKKIDQRSEIELFKGEETNLNNEDSGLHGKKRKIRAAGETRIKRRNQGPSAPSNSSNHLIKCPITQKMIPESSFDKHLKILLGDPHYKSEREKYKAKHKLTNLTSNEVYENIKKIAKTSSG